MRKVIYSKFYQAVKTGTNNETWYNDKDSCVVAKVSDDLLKSCMIIDDPKNDHLICVPITNVPFFTMARAESEDGAIARKPGRPAKTA